MKNRYKLSIDIDENRNRLVRLREGAAVLMVPPAYCSNTPKQRYFDKAFQFSLIYSRYTNRMCYHAENFLNELEKITSLNFREPENNKEFMISIDNDALYYEFDSFIWSAKSLVEGNIQKRAKSLNPRISQIFKQTNKLHFDEFVDPFLSKIRDEVVHINKFGISLSSQMSLKRENDETKLIMRSLFGPFINEHVDLIEVFGYVLERMEEIFKDVSGLILSHFFEMWGGPNESSSILFAHKSIDLSYFNIVK